MSPVVVADDPLADDALERLGLALALAAGHVVEPGEPVTAVRQFGHSLDLVRARPDLREVSRLVDEDGVVMVMSFSRIGISLTSFYVLPHSEPGVHRASKIR
jgi:hypothetical protein